jgi:GGDEF domain-containing protein
VHGAWILATAAAFAVRISADAHVGAAVMVARLLAVVVPAVAATMGIQLGIWDLRNDANDSLADPLTGLLNRRGLHLHIGNLLRDNTTMASEVAVLVADLDRFKQINDTFGQCVAARWWRGLAVRNSSSSISPIREVRSTSRSAAGTRSQRPRPIRPPPAPA